MATYTIKEGKHHNTRWFLSDWAFWGKKEFRKSVQFTSSCVYTLADYNSEDVNKLYGASFGFLAIHTSSARFGWRYSRSKQQIELLAYVYDRGQRNWDSQLRFPIVASVPIGETVTCSLRVTPTDYVFHVTQGDTTLGELVTVPHSKVPAWGFSAGLWFGGSQPAPQTIYVIIDTL